LGGKGLQDSILVYSILLGVITCGSFLYLVNIFFFLNTFLYLGKKLNLAIKVTLCRLVKLIYNYYIKLKEDFKVKSTNFLSISFLSL